MFILSFANNFLTKLKQHPSSPHSFDSPSPLTLTPSMRRRGLATAMGCTAASALGLGGLLPLLSIILERNGVPSTLIGLNAAMPFVAALLLMPFIPMMMAKIRGVYLLGLAGLLSTVTTLAYGFYQELHLWFPLRFINGLALGVLFSVSEAWVNHYAEEKTRGRLIGFYATLLGGCFSVGPLILWAAGTQGIAPFALCAGLILISSLSVIWGWRLPEAFQKTDDDDEESVIKSFTKFLVIAPTLSFAGIIFGAMEAVVVSFVPVYSLRLGFTETIAAISLTFFSLGNVCCQIPLGIIADRYGRRRMLFICSFVATSAMVALAVLFSFFAGTGASTLALFALILFIFGGSAVGIYTMAMAEMGERFKGAALANANAALLFCYNFGSLSMPVLSGKVMDAAPYAGLPLLLGILCASVMLPTLWRQLSGLRRKA